jgi:hypothetical protein
MTEMRPYDIRVSVERIEGRSVCGLEVGDYFEVTESNRVRIFEGRPAPSGRRGLVRAGQSRRVARPDERVIMWIERVGERTL